MRTLAASSSRSGCTIAEVFDVNHQRGGVTVVLREDNIIAKVTEDKHAHYEPYGWHHWPEHPWLAYQFRRGLGETQEGGGSVSECFLAASRMIPGDLESWHREWMAVADFNFNRGVEEERQRHIRTAMNCWLRAADYYRQ